MFRLFISRRSAASFALLSFIFLFLLLLLSNSLVVWTVDDDDDFARSNLLRDFDNDKEDFRCFRENNNAREEAEEEADVTVGVLVLFACKKSDLVSIFVTFQRSRFRRDFRQSRG